jgi:hypothetical protein
MAMRLTARDEQPGEFGLGDPDQPQRQQGRGDLQKDGNEEDDGHEHILVPFFQKGLVTTQFF